MAVTYRTVDLGYVQSVSRTDNAGIASFPLPGEDSANNVIYNLGGKTTRVSVQTTYTGIEAEVTSKITAIKALMPGGSDGGALVLPNETIADSIMESMSYTVGVSDGPVGIVKFSYSFLVGSVIPLWEE